MFAQRTLGMDKRTNVLAPPSSDASVLERQDLALYQVRTKLSSRSESCNVVVLSASTLCRTIMMTQLQSRGWSANTANHLADATSIIHQQVAKAKSRGFNVSRVADAVAGGEAPKYDAAGVRIKYADHDAVARLVLVDCFVHEPLEEIVQHIRLLDNNHNLGIVICYLTMPRPTEGQGYVIAPEKLLTLAEAYESGADLVIPTFFDRSVVEFLTEVFLSSSGRYLKSGTTSATMSNFSQIRSLLLDVTDRDHTKDLAALHHTSDETGGVPNLARYTAQTRGGDTIDDDLEAEVNDARKKEENKREMKRQELMRRQNAADAIDTNPEYISLLSKYEICLRQLSQNKDKMTELNATIDLFAQQKGDLATQVEQHVLEEERLRNLVNSLQMNEDASQRNKIGGQHNQLVQREMKISALEKEAAGYKLKYESTKKSSDDATALVSKLQRELEDAKRHIVNLNKRFETRLRALGVTGIIDLDTETEKHDDKMQQLQGDVRRLTGRSRAMLERIEALQTSIMATHDYDSFGKQANLLIGGVNKVINAEEFQELLRAHRAPRLSLVPDGKTHHASGSASPGSHPGSSDTAPLLPLGSGSPVPAASSEPNANSGNMETASEVDVPEMEAFKLMMRGDNSEDHSLTFLRSLHMTMDQLTDMSAPETIEDDGVLVAEAHRAVADGDNTIAAVRHQRQIFAEARRHQRADDISLGRIRMAAMFTDEQLSKRKASSMMDLTSENMSPAATAMRVVQGQSDMVGSVGMQALRTIAERISTELTTLVEGVDAAQQQEEENQRAIEVAVNDYTALSKAEPVQAYEAALVKMREYLINEVQKREDDVKDKAKRADELEKCATELARWQMLLDEALEKLSTYARTRESGSLAHRRREQLEQQLEVLEAKAIRMIPEMSISRQVDDYVQIQKEILTLRREIRALPSSRSKGPRVVSPLSSSMRSNDSKTSQSADEPLTITELAEKALGAHIQLTNKSFGLNSPTTPVVPTPTRDRARIRRRSTALAETLMSLEHQLHAQSGTQLERSGSMTMSSKVALPAAIQGAVSDNGSSVFALSPADAGLAPVGVVEASSSPNTNTMHSIASDMISRFRSYSVVKKSQPAVSSGLGLRDVVSGIQTMVQAKMQSAQQEFQAMSSDAHAFRELNLTSIEALLERTRDIPTPPILYQLIIVYHKELIRLLRQLKRRTSLTSINIIDAHHLQKQLLKDNRSLTKAQQDNIPFILSVDAAQVSRFADYFEKETEMLVREGIARLQRHVDDTAAKELNLDVRNSQDMRRSISREDLSRHSSRGGGDESSRHTSRRVSSSVGGESDPETHTAHESSSTARRFKKGGTPLSVTPQSTPQANPLSVPSILLSVNPKGSPESIALAIPTGQVTTQPPTGILAPLVPMHTTLPPYNPLDVPRPSMSEVIHSSGQILASSPRSHASHLTASVLAMRAFAHHAPQPTQSVLSMISYGGEDAVREQHRVIYVPRTPATQSSTRPMLARRSEMTARQKFIDDVVHKIAPTNTFEPIGGPYVPQGQWSAKPPPPSRQRAAAATQR